MQSTPREVERAYSGFFAEEHTATWRYRAVSGLYAGRYVILSRSAEVLSGTRNDRRFVIYETGGKSIRPVRTSPPDFGTRRAADRYITGNLLGFTQRTLAEIGF